MIPPSRQMVSSSVINHNFDPNTYNRPGGLTNQKKQMGNTGDRAHCNKSLTTSLGSTDSNVFHRTESRCALVIFIARVQFKYE